MDEIFGLKDWGKMHHAYIISGADLDEIWENLEQNLLFRKTANADAFSRAYETFGIDEARELTEWATTKPILGEKKVAVIRAVSFTTEAQNALLKLFEEPPQNTYFFITVPHLGVILPTLRSRVRAVLSHSTKTTNQKLESFLESSVAERLSLIAGLIKNKDHEKARDFISSLEKKIEHSNHFTRAKKILQAEKYVGTRGSSVKMILEYLAVSL